METLLEALGRQIGIALKWLHTDPCVNVMVHIVIRVLGSSDLANYQAEHFQAEQDSTMGMIQRDTNGFWRFGSTLHPEGPCLQTNLEPLPRELTSLSYGPG